MATNSSGPPGTGVYSGDLTVNEEIEPIFHVNRTRSLSTTMNKSYPGMEHKITEIHKNDSPTAIYKELDLNHPDIIFAINLGVQLRELNDVTGLIKPKLKADLQNLISDACMRAVDKKVTFCLENNENK